MRWSKRFGDGEALDGVGNEDGFRREVGLVADVILVESGDNTVAIFGNELVEKFFGCSYPVCYLFECFGIVTLLVSNVEVAIPKRLVVVTLAYPLIIHTECTEKDFCIVTAEIFVNRKDVLGFDLKKHGVDELYYIVMSQLGE